MAGCQDQGSDLVSRSQTIHERLALIYIKTVTGYNFSLEVELNDTVKSVKEKIQEEKGVYKDSYSLTRCLQIMALPDNNTIHLV